MKISRKAKDVAADLAVYALGVLIFAIAVRDEDPPPARRK